MDFVDGLPQVAFGDCEIANLCGILLGGIGSAFTELRLGFYPEGFVPLTSGLNCVYGLNGSGKTRFLSVVTAVLDRQQGDTEGLVFTDIVFVTGVPAEESDDAGPRLTRLADASDLIADLDSGGGWRVPRAWAASFAHEKDVEVIPFRYQVVDLQGLAGEILREALDDPNLLITRQLNRYDEDQLVVVPAILEGCRGPRVRQHIAELRESFKAVETELRVLLPTGGTLGEIEEWRSECVEAQMLWLEEHSSSPLLNARTVNFENLGSSWIEDAAAPRPVQFLEDDRAPLLLPPIASCRGDSLGSLYDELDDSPSPMLQQFGDYIGEPPKLMFREPASRDELQSELADITRQVLAEGLPDERDTLAVRLGADADRIYRAMLPAAGALALEFGTPDEWLSGTHPRWLRDDEVLELGSNAQHRWALFAIAAVLSPSTRFMLLDEPESGLHRTAEQSIAVQLATTELLPGRVVIAATHSPAFIDAPGVNLVHARAYEPLQRMRPETRHDVQALGMAPSDVLALTRAFLLVEGQHDKIVLSTLLGSELAALGVSILSMGGAKSLEEIGASDFLYEFTDAALLVLLDHLDTQQMQTVWRHARVVAQKGDLPGAKHIVLRDLRGMTVESEALASFLVRCLNDGNHERVGFLGLTEPDVIHYLPVRSFMDEESWDEVNNEYLTYRNQRRGRDKPHPYKTWLRETKGAKITVETVYEAAESMDYIPPEFTNLLNSLAAIATRRV